MATNRRHNRRHLRNPGSGSDHPLKLEPGGVTRRASHGPFSYREVFVTVRNTNRHKSRLFQ